MDASVLVTAAGSIVAQGIIKSLKLANQSKNVTYRIVATDMDPLAPGLYRCDSGVLVPPATSPDYIEVIIGACKKHHVNAIFVGSDDELLVIARAKERIESETGAKVITGPADILATARDKWKTYEFLRANNFQTAASALPEDRQKFVADFGFPLVVKPRQGYGSLHFYVAKNKEEMDLAISAIEKAGWSPMIQEYLDGENTEFTSGVTIDRNAKYVMSSISIRKSLKHGQTYKAIIDDFYNVRKSAEEVALRLGSNGSVNIQAKIHDDVPVIFEINPRFSATCPMRAVAGVNEPDIVFRNEVLGEEIKVDSYQKLVCMRYWNEVYIPLPAFEKASDSRIIEGNSSFIPDYF